MPKPKLTGLSLLGAAASALEAAVRFGLVSGALVAVALGQFMLGGALAALAVGMFLRLKRGHVSK
jgi:hypothetical protein